MKWDNAARTHLYHSDRTPPRIRPWWAFSQTLPTRRCWRRHRRQRLLLMNRRLRVSFLWHAPCGLGTLLGFWWRLQLERDTTEIIRRRRVLGVGASSCGGYAIEKTRWEFIPSGCGGHYRAMSGEFIFYYDRGSCLSSAIYQPEQALRVTPVISGIMWRFLCQGNQRDEWVLCHNSWVLIKFLAPSSPRKLVSWVWGKSFPGKSHSGSQFLGH